MTQIDKAKQKEYWKKPEYKAKKKKYYQRPEVKARRLEQQRKRALRPEVKAKRKLNRTYEKIN